MYEDMFRLFELRRKESGNFKKSLHSCSELHLEMTNFLEKFMKAYQGSTKFCQKAFLHFWMCCPNYLLKGGRDGASFLAVVTNAVRTSFSLHSAKESRTKRNDLVFLGFHAAKGLNVLLCIVSQCKGV